MKYTIKNIKLTDVSDEIASAMKMMRDAGLVPTGTGKPTLPKRSADHYVIWDRDEQIWFLIVEMPDEISVWAIDVEGKSEFVGNFKGKFQAGQNQDEYGEHEYADYVELPVMQAILDIVDPEWNQPGEGEEQEELLNLTDLTEDFKTSAKRFQDQGAKQAKVDAAIADFKKLKPRITDPIKKDIAPGLSTPGTLVFTSTYDLGD